MTRVLNLSLSLGDLKRLREMSACLSVPQSSIVVATCKEASRLMEAGEYKPPANKDYVGPPISLRGDASAFGRLKYLCLISDLCYTASSGRQRHITAGKVIRDVLHCMLNLHEAGVQLNLEAGNGK